MNVRYKITSQITRYKQSFSLPDIAHLNKIIARGAFVTPSLIRGNSYLIGASGDYQGSIR
jgi:hypothetical protein